MPLCPQELGTCEQAPLLLSSLPLRLLAPDLLPSCFRQFPDRGVPLPKTKLPHLSTTGPKPCKPFHLVSASPLKAVDLQSAGILKPLLGASGSFGSPEATPAALEDLRSPTCNSTTSSCHFSFTFLSSSCFPPSDWQFLMLSSNQENCLWSLTVEFPWKHALSTASHPGSGRRARQSRSLMKIPQTSDGLRLKALAMRESGEHTSTEHLSSLHTMDLGHLASS